MTDDDLQLVPDDDARIDAILRSMSPADLELPELPTDLWASIEAAVADDADGRDRGTTSATAEPVAEVIDLRSRTRRPMLFAAAAAVVLLVAAFVTTRGDDAPSYEVVGEAELGWQDGFVIDGVDATAAATLLADADERAVRIDSAALPTAPTGEDLELWLIGVQDDGELVIQSLGLIDDPSADTAYTVPDGFDMNEFGTVLVDISFEPRDGVATHSGASVIRGPVHSV